MYSLSRQDAMTVGQVVPKGELVRGLGLSSSTAIVVGTMIGTGIFLKPSEVAREAGSVEWALVAWVVGGALTLLGALSYLELGTAMPEAGADYAYLSRGIGPAWGFLYGWKGSVVSGPASIAAGASGCILFLGYLWPAVVAPVARLGPWDMTWGQLLAAAIILTLALVNLFPVRTVGRVQVVLTSFKVISLVAVIGLGLLLSQRGGALHQPVAPTGDAGSYRGFIAAVAACLWTYSGWHTLLRLGSEIKDPGRTMPQAVVAGLVGTAALFLLVNVACFSVLSLADVQGSSHAVSDMLERVTGRSVAGVLTVVMIVSALGSLTASFLASGRIPYAMARDGYLPKSVGWVNPRSGAPSGAVAWKAALAACLVMTGTFEDLSALFVFSQWLFYALGIIALFRLRRLEPDLPRPVRAWGYPVAPGIFVVLSVILTVSILVDRPVRSLLGLALIAAGLPVYYYTVRRRRL